MIYHDKFPFLSHLTFEEIAERDELKARKRSGDRWYGGARARLQMLEARSVVIPPEPETADAG